MKAKNLWVLLLTTLIFFGCDDNTGSLGMGMLPPSDKVTVGAKTFSVTTKSTLSGPVFAKTSIGYVGKFTDPDFGYYETSFLTQLNCTDNLTFPEAYDETKKYERNDIVMAGDSVYLAEITLLYDGYFGDSLNACKMSVYALNKKLDKNHYTNIDPEIYYDEKDLLAQAAYTAYDSSISKEERASEGYRPHLRLRISKDIGERILRLNREHPEYFADADAFIENVFKGLYVKSDYGDGTILYISQVSLDVVYNCYKIDSLGGILQTTEGEDSIMTYSKTFSATKEVIQANRFNNSEQLVEKAGEKDWTYIKSPAGIYTQATLPIQQIANELKNDTLNAVKVVFDGHRQESENLFSMSAPSTILMIREKEVKDFFEKNKLYDGITSFVTTYQKSGETANQYIFSNITRLILTCINEKEQAKKEAGSSWDEQKWIEETQWDKVVLIPVIVNLDSAGDQPISIQNDMRPGYVKLKGGEKDQLEMKVYYTYFDQ